VTSYKNTSYALTSLNKEKISLAPQLHDAAAKTVKKQVFWRLWAPRWGAFKGCSR